MGALRGGPLAWGHVEIGHEGAQPTLRKGLAKWLRRSVAASVLLFFAAPLCLLLIYLAVPPPVTPLMLIRLLEGEGLDRRWVGLSEISPHLPRAVIASEDNTFCQHGGFDWRAIDEAMDNYRDGKRLRGASTLSMQTSKNLFLWPGRNYLRKGLEAYMTVMLELLWSKQRILEVYLNVAEWSSGVYGAEAAARHYFKKAAKDLTRREAALLATVLPNPRQRSAARPTARQRRQASVVTKRVGQIAPRLDCF